jgi:phenylpyruvate tautomerase PptA (4-oxalocrotonate tautomerase family)
MPLLSLTTNRKIDDHQSVLATCSSQVSKIIEKPEQYVMVKLEDEVSLSFGGNSDDCAYVEFKSIGLPVNETKFLSSQLSALIEKTVGVSQDRIYIEFADASRSLWGWNGTTF